MICLELIGVRPPGCSSYYTLCVRGSYTIGRHENNDVVLQSQEVSRQHASIVIAVLPESRNTDKNKSGLSAAITNYSKFGTIVDDVLVTDELSCPLFNGSVISLGGSHVDMRVTFRPVIVSLTRTQYTAGYVTSLARSLRQLGAQVLDGPPIPSDVPTEAELRKRQHQLDREKERLAQTSGTASLDSTQAFSGTATTNAAAAVAIQELLQSTYERPLLRIFCCEEIDDSPDTLLALALGYSIVQPSFVFELFSLVAEGCTRALHELQHPATLEPPVSKNTFGALMYLRPEYGAVPFSLYDQPKVGVNRSRHALLARRTFCFHSRAVQEKVGMVVAASGGKVIFNVRDADPIKHAPIYLVVQSQEFEAMCTAPFDDDDGGDDYDDDESPYRRRSSSSSSADPVLRYAKKLGFTIISEHTISAAVLTNRFAPVTLASVRGAMQDNPHHYHHHAHGSAQYHHLFHHRDLEEEEEEEDTARNNAAKSRKETAGGRAVTSNEDASSAGSRSKKLHSSELTATSFGEGYFGKKRRSAAAAAAANRNASFGSVDDDGVDSDATPSDIDSDRGDVRHWDDAADHGFDNDDDDDYGERGASTAPMYVRDPKRFAQLVEKLRLISDRNIVPSFARIRDINASATKNRFVSEASVAYLIAVFDKCSKQLRSIEELSRSAEGNSHSQRLQRYWDVCIKVQESIRTALRNGKRQNVINERGMDAAEEGELFLVEDAAVDGDGGAAVHYVDPVLSDEEEQSRRLMVPARSPPTRADPQQQQQRGSVSPPRPTSVRATIENDAELTSKSRPRSNNYASLSRGTRLARYFPPPPVKARIHVKPPRKVTLDSAAYANDPAGDLKPRTGKTAVELAHLWIHIAPSDLRGVRNHREVFVRQYGALEGGQNFRMWLQSQTVDWNNQFHQTLEGVGISVSKLFSDDVAVQAII